ncbi:hypothetical protein FOA52_008540 [Chlamydomonas sp. UWO 241]|nr:hypothetical protein FOA52_008540 [Chlamydomonas sp. UWO 241]
MQALQEAQNMSADELRKALGESLAKAQRAEDEKQAALAKAQAALEMAQRADDEKQAALERAQRAEDETQAALKQVAAARALGRAEGERANFPVPSPLPANGDAFNVAIPPHSSGADDSTHMRCLWWQPVSPVGANWRARVGGISHRPRRKQGFWCLRAVGYGVQSGTTRVGHLTVDH